MWFVKYTFLIDGDNSINHFRVLNNLLCCVYCLNFECFTIDKSNAVKLSREIIWFRDIFQKIRQGWDRPFKASVRYFSVFLKDKCISSLFRTKYIEKKFTLQLFFFPLFHEDLFSPGLPCATCLLKTSCLEKVTVCVIETMRVTLPLVQMNKAQREGNRTNQVQTKINIMKGLQTSVIT